MASYNSAFLENLFEDIAASSSEEESNKDMLQDVGSSVETPLLSMAVPSNHNLYKRRRVSTNKSLGRCTKSLANLASLTDFGSKNKSSGLLTGFPTTTKPKPQKDLPATVSASYSFTLDLALIKQDRIKQDKEEKSQQDDFGWFVDTDDQDEHGVRAYVSEDFGGKADVPLAFSAATAPRVDTRDLQAEVDWAQAADTVDEVLGDFF